MFRCLKRMGAKEKEEYIRKSTTVFFVYSGFWKSKTNHQLNLPVAIFHLIIMVAGFLSLSYMFVLKYDDDIDVNTEILLHLVQLFHAISYHLILITKKKSLDHLAEVLDMTVDNMNLPVKDRLKHAAILQKERDSCVRLMACMFSLISALYSSIILEKAILFMVGKQRLLYPSWFPFETDSDHKMLYFTAILFQLTIYADLLFIGSVITVLWFWTIHLVCGILSIVGTCFKSLDVDGRNGKYLGVEYTGSLNKKVKQKLVHYVDLHVFARGLVHKLNFSMEIGFFELVVTFQCTICFCGFHVVEAARSGELYRMFKFFIGVAVFSQVLYITCSSGQKLINRSDELYQTLYGCGWPDQAQWLKTSIYICQTVSKKPPIIHAVHVFQANLHTFLLSMKAVYSYLNFLEAMKNKT